MKNTFFIAVAICIFASSCSKKIDNDQLQDPAPQFENNNVAVQHWGPAKKEETRPIVILKPVRPNGIAIQSLITFINGLDTLVGQTSENEPNHLFQLTKTGEWLVNVTSEGYISLSETINYVDSFVYQVDTLQPAQ